MSPLVFSYNAVQLTSPDKPLSGLLSLLFTLPHRTVKNEDDVVEMDHQEQTYTITGAADDSDVE